MSQSKPEAQNKLHGITALVFLCLLALHLPFVFFKPEHPPGSASPTLVLNLSQSAAGEASAPEEPYSPPEPPPREIPEPEPLPAVTEDAVQEPVPAEPAEPAKPQETSAETSAAHSGQEGSSALPSTTPADIGGSASTARGVEDARYRILRETPQPPSESYGPRQIPCWIPPHSKRWKTRSPWTWSCHRRWKCR